MTTAILEPIRNLSHLDALVAGSRVRPLLLFKHSQSCGTSHVANEELQEHLAQSPREVDYAIVTVQEQRNLSDSIAQRFSLRHETPQALLIRNGQLVWVASHFRVTASAISRAIDEATTAAGTA
jgi:bacillithiol system protein YtxJ